MVASKRGRLLLRRGRGGRPRNRITLTGDGRRETISDAARFAAGAGRIHHRYEWREAA
jgi:hypothetical protein